MQHTITTAQLATDLDDIIHRVRHKSERFIIEQDGEPIASLGPTPELAKASTWQDLRRVLQSVPSPDSGFADDLEEIQRSQPLAPDSLWDS
jgi:antitoxin (DNA-binding transcriptional repressor) of toxin-antitoxin stability system